MNTSKWISENHRADQYATPNASYEAEGYAANVRHVTMDVDPEAGIAAHIALAVCMSTLVPMN